MARLKVTFPWLVNPWVYFMFFSFSNAVISYSPFPCEVKGWVFFLGLLLPCALYWKLAPSPFSKEKPWNEKEFIRFSPRLWTLWAFLILAALFLRFYKLTSFYLWPTGDEGLHGFYAIDLVKSWNWQFFYTVGEHPPLLIWMLSFFFRFFDNPFFNLWFLPALLSTISVPLSYFAARSFFSKNFSLICGVLMAFSFWPLYFGRFCHQGIWMPPWELTGFLFWGLFLHEKKASNRKIWITVLGLWIGLGCLTFPAWSVVALLFVLMVGGWVARKPVPAPLLFLIFGAALAVGDFPFLAAVWKEGYGHHFIDSSSASHWFSTEHAWTTHLSYITSLFWGSLQEGTSYGPVWGGILNPFLGSCFLIGFLDLWKNWRNPKTWCLLGAFILCLFPGFLSSDYVEFNRIITLMPFLLLTAAVGIQKLLTRIPTSQKGTILALLISVSLALDLFHLLKPTLVFSAPLKVSVRQEIPDESYRAYQILNAVQRRWGPGLLFTDFLLLSHNHTLYVTTYHFNAASNPRLDASQARWAAILANIHYEPFLLKRFPGSQWCALGKGLSNTDGGMVVGLVLVTSQNRSVFESWLQVHGYFHHLNREAEDILNNQARYTQALQKLPQGYDLVRGDPYLESVFGEWVAQYHFSPSYRENAQAIQTAIQRGYATAHLYYKLGNFLVLGNHIEEAKEAFRKANRLKPNYTTSAEDLQELEKMYPEPRKKQLAEGKGKSL